MANEITVTASLSVTKGNMNRVGLSDDKKTFTLTGNKYVAGIQNIATSEEAIDMGEVTSPGWAYFRNLDATNFISIRRATGEGNFLKLLAGESAGPFRLAATAPFAIADTAACNLQYIIFEA